MAMKKSLLVTIALVGIVFSLSGCKKNKASDFDYPIETLYGTWRITHVEQKNGTMLNVTHPDIENTVFKPTYATFNADGTFSGRGKFGSGKGTYTAKGKTITCYIDGKEYMRYDVLSLSGDECELKVYLGGEYLTRVRCKKQ